MSVQASVSASGVCDPCHLPMSDSGAGTTCGIS